jgi:deoxyribodipyrimidine photo-lyase
MDKLVVSIFWYRRDLRLVDNIALFNSLKSKFPVIPVFIFDNNILDELDENDSRVGFIYQQLSEINNTLNGYNSSLKIIKNNVINAWEELINEFEIKEVFYNTDFEPYALKRDNKLASFFDENGVVVNTFTDHVIFDPKSVLKDDGTPYLIYTPYKNKWLKQYENKNVEILPELVCNNFVKVSFNFPSLSEIGFSHSQIKVKRYNFSELDNYELTRNYPSLNSTSFLGPHLRFGTVSIRMIINNLNNKNSSFLNELIWREFFIQILFHFPRVINENFKIKYNGIIWRNNEQEFDLWCKGETGYPIVDAGMRQLNNTGYMHNRVRMITASFLCKHLLIDWRWGEAYFANKLLDFELASNNGNWQWVAGTGCDSAPYFRVFSPSAQTLKFDSKLEYINKWVPELNEIHYKPIVNHSDARDRAIKAYKKGLENTFI